MGRSGSLRDTTVAAELSGGHIALPSTLPVGLSAFSFETWIYFEGTSPYERISDFGNSGGGNGYLFLTADNGTGNMRFAITASGSYAEQAFNTPLLGTGWRHLILTLDGTNCVIYVDGGQTATGAISLTPASISSYNSVTIGRSQFGGDALLSARLSHAVVYSKVLSSSEVATHALAR